MSMLVLSGLHLMRLEYQMEDGYSILHCFAEPPYAQLRLRINYPFLTLIEPVNPNCKSILQYLESNAYTLATTKTVVRRAMDFPQYSYPESDLNTFISNDELTTACIDIKSLFGRSKIEEGEVGNLSDLDKYFPDGDLAVGDKGALLRKFRDTHLREKIKNSRFVAFLNVTDRAVKTSVLNGGAPVNGEYAFPLTESPVNYILQADTLCGIAIPVPHAPEYLVRGGSLVVPDAINLGNSGNEPEERILHETVVNWNIARKHGPYDHHATVASYDSNKVIYMLSEFYGTQVPEITEYVPVTHGPHNQVIVAHPEGLTTSVMETACIRHRFEYLTYPVISPDYKSQVIIDRFWPILDYRWMDMKWSAVSVKLPYKPSIFS